MFPGGEKFKCGKGMMHWCIDGIDKVSNANIQVYIHAFFIIFLFPSEDKTVPSYIIDRYPVLHEFAWVLKMWLQAKITLNWKGNCEKWHFN